MIFFDLCQIKQIAPCQGEHEHERAAETAFRHSVGDDGDHYLVVRNNSMGMPIDLSVEDDARCPNATVLRSFPALTRPGWRRFVKKGAGAGHRR
ncbi:hypothetical protein EVAR_68194_1 [Eumeta japonica]|uniref:Uncharacterized protein n=1 Tax=Eumeta variegata TaxID=151549 RepID=A0A4C1ZY06_EUMVA|nr:hypothetical protein EVAR_68194_1 [Eumeta japonica]